MSVARKKGVFGTESRLRVPSHLAFVPIHHTGRARCFAFPARRLRSAPPQAAVAPSRTRLDFLWLRSAQDPPPPLRGSFATIPYLSADIRGRPTSSFRQPFVRLPGLKGRQTGDHIPSLVPV